MPSRGRGEIWPFVWLLLLSVCLWSNVQAQVRSNLFFLHHSTGSNLVYYGQMRPYLNNYNATYGTHLAFWDHGYNSQGIRDSSGTWVGHSYGIPSDNTDPDGLHYLWTVANAARDSIMANHEVIAFKSCYPASAIGSEAELAQYQTWYLAMRDYFDLHPEKIFVVMSTPPLHRLATNAADAARARAFSVWLNSAAYLSGHPNVVCFDLFDQFAQPADGSPTQNMLRYEYEPNHSSSDSHPNLLANQTVGPVFADFLATVAGGGTAEAAPPSVRLAGERLVCVPNPVRTTACVRYLTVAPGWTDVSIFDAAGRRQVALVRRYDAAGDHAILWDLGSAETTVRPGVYWARLERDGVVMGRQKLVVVR